MDKAVLYNNECYWFPHVFTKLNIRVPPHSVVIGDDTITADGLRRYGWYNNVEQFGGSIPLDGVGIYNDGWLRFPYFGTDLEYVVMQEFCPSPLLINEKQFSPHWVGESNDYSVVAALGRLFGYTNVDIPEQFTKNYQLIYESRYTPLRLQDYALTKMYINVEGITHVRRIYQKKN